MVPKLKFGSTIVLLLGLLIGLKFYSSPSTAQEKTFVHDGLAYSPKLLPSQSKNLKSVAPLYSSSTKLRNPFIPMHLESNMHNLRVQNISESQVPNAPALPVLKGILEQSGRQFAIIEYNNKSHLCALGNNVSSYTLKGLTAFSAFLEHKNGEVVEIYMGKKK